MRGITGGRLVTLDLDGDTLMWRVPKTDAAAAENIVTTLHEVRFAELRERKFHLATLGLVALAALNAVFGFWLRTAVLGVLAGLTASYRVLYPRRVLMLDLGGRSLQMNVDPACVVQARALTARIADIIARGEQPAAPPMLP